MGSDRTVKVEARVIVATNRDLDTMVEDGTFRFDLWQRLDVIRIYVPPLYEHPEDIPALARHSWQRLGKRKSEELPKDVVDQLCLHDWRGNVRQLRTTLEALHAACPDIEPTVDHLMAVFDERMLRRLRSVGTEARRSALARQSGIAGQEPPRLASRPGKPPAIPGPGAPATTDGVAPYAEQETVQLPASAELPGSPAFIQPVELRYDAAKLRDLVHRFRDDQPLYRKLGQLLSEEVGWEPRHQGADPGLYPAPRCVTGRLEPIDGPVGGGGIRGRWAGIRPVRCALG